MQTLTVEIIGVSSQRSGDVLVRAGAQGGAGNGLRFICTEAEADLSDYDEAVVDCYLGSRPAVSSHFMKEKGMREYEKFWAFRARFDLFTVCSNSCKNVPI
jgi:hypothetical protein